RADDGLALVERQNRKPDLPGQLADLLTAPAPLAPGPGHHPVARQVAELVLVPGIVEGVRRASAGVADGGMGFLLPAGVEDHAASLSRRAITSGTCSRYAP